jgi:hypothetical protein
MDPPTNDRYTKPDLNQLPTPPDFIKSSAFKPSPAYDFPSPPNGPPRFVEQSHVNVPPPFVERAKDVVERLLPLLTSKNLRAVVGLLDNPRGLINPSSSNYNELMEIKKQIPSLSEEEKQYLKTIIGDEPPKDVLERLTSNESLTLEDLQFVARLLDYPDGPINPAAKNYELLVEIKKLIPLLTKTKNNL